MTQQMSYADDEINYLDYWRVIWKRRWLLGGLFMVSVLTAMIVTLRMPPIYESNVTLLPALDSKDGGGLSGLFAASGTPSGFGGAAQSLGISLPGISATSVDIFVAMLKSRIMADAVIQQFGLMELYEAKTMQDARQALEGITKITISKEKIIKITVEDKNPQLAADIANFYVSNLDHLNRTFNVSKASQHRAFIEGRLVELQADLVKAEETLKEFQTHNKTVAVEAQSTAMIQAAAMIQAQISAQEVQLQVLSGYLSLDNPELSRVRSSIEELKKQLYLIESGKGGKGMLPGDRLHPAMITVPRLALEYGRLLRELKVRETLNALLTSQYEQAKLAESRDTPTVQVLDPAIRAEKKSKPSIRLNTMVVGALAFFVGIFLAFFMEYLERIGVRPAQEPANVRSQS